MNGASLVAIMSGLLIGWQCWRGGKLVDERLHLLAANERIEARRELGDEDSSTWEVAENGDLRDPWISVTRLPLNENGEEYTFSTSSQGGKRAIGELCKAYAKKHGSNTLPIVTLKSGAYNHPNKAYGRIKIPVFKITGWTDAEPFEGAAALPPPNSPAGGGNVATFPRVKTALAGPSDEIPF